MLTIYPIYEDQKLHIDLVLDQNGKKYIDPFNRLTLIVDFYTPKYYTGSKWYKNSDPYKILKKFWINKDDKYNGSWITVKQAIQNGMNYIKGKIKYL